MEGQSGGQAVIGKSIVIVEDDVLLSQTVSIGLRKRGHCVTVFHTGADALSYLSRERPDLLLLDIKLPDCDGWFLARLLERLELSDRMPLIMMSVLEPDRRMVAEVRPYAYLQKPFDMGHLMQTVEASLGG